MLDKGFLDFFKFVVEIRRVVCPDCGEQWVTPITEEDIEDGVGDKILCSKCLLVKIVKCRDGLWSLYREGGGPA
ncbi:MAG: hypothetical protein UV22_C0005G0015 [Parcubacteria group bacterium GW2011_GWA2_42_35]|nr:MAG: hypothetical protein UU96_C0012G0017 [Parcubacteria group bacterium GW2011_GWC2_42_13]KKS58126.1 MAG: hypothetical protein UV22_C0005G0015 [Parcubacteria group bacterium GW2011_GWA2_42_35]